jgi:hypothetical protein
VSVSDVTVNAIVGGIVGCQCLCHCQCQCLCRCHCQSLCQCHCQMSEPRPLSMSLSVAWPVVSANVNIGVCVKVSVSASISSGDGVGGSGGQQCDRRAAAARPGPALNRERMALWWWVGGPSGRYRAASRGRDTIGWAAWQWSPGPPDRLTEPRNRIRFGTRGVGHDPSLATARGCGGIGRRARFRF